MAAGPNSEPREKGGELHALDVGLLPAEFHPGHFQNLLDESRNRFARERELIDDGFRRGHALSLQDVEINPHRLKGLSEVVVGRRKETRPPLAFLLRRAPCVFGSLHLDAQTLDEARVFGVGQNARGDEFVQLSPRIKNEARHEDEHRRENDGTHAVLPRDRHREGRHRKEREGGERRHPAGIDRPPGKRHGDRDRDRHHLQKSRALHDEENPGQAPNGPRHDGEHRPAAHPGAHVFHARVVAPELSHENERDDHLCQPDRGPGNQKDAAVLRLPIHENEASHPDDLRGDRDGKEPKAPQNDARERSRRKTSRARKAEEALQKVERNGFGERHFLFLTS